MSSSSYQDKFSEMMKLHELTRQGKNLCEGCGKPKQMYYRPWCPICEKPEVYGRELNLLQALEHLEAIGNPGIKNTFWQYLTKYYDFYNDTAFAVDLMFSADDLDYYAEEYIDTLKLIKETWGLGENVLFYVSW